MVQRSSHNKVSVVRYALLPESTDAWFVRIITEAARVARKHSRPVHIILVGDARMRHLNAAYRHKNTTTDVLSFPADGERSRDEWPKNYEDAQERDYLGEIVLCVPQLRRQAREYEVPFHQEAARMAIHGFLHLWGYDHIKPHEARIMMPLQEKILKNFELRKCL